MTRSLTLGAGLAVVVVVMAALNTPMTQGEANNACRRKSGDDATFNQATREFTCRNPRTGEVIARWRGH